jgi:hypothetical protein
LAHKYLGLDLNGLPFEEEARHLPVWLIKALEKEWESGVRLQGLISVKNDPKLLFQQIKKRLPPNPIQATIDLEGEFDDGGRIKYQILNIFQRINWSLRKLIFPNRK